MTETLFIERIAIERNRTLRKAGVNEYGDKGRLTWLSERASQIGASLLAPKNNYAYNFVEVGSLEGRSAVWLLENVLQHPDSKLSCVDMWNENIDDHEYNADLMKGIYNRFLHNISPYSHKVDVYRGKSFDALRHPRLTEQSFDFVYVDGGHSSRNALEDAILSFGLLKVGGFMIFDDYFSNLKDPHNLNSPKLGIDTFLTMYSGSVSIVHINYQLYVTKTAE
eukprot:gene8022-9561_t